MVSLLWLYIESRVGIIDNSLPKFKFLFDIIGYDFLIFWSLKS